MNESKLKFDEATEESVAAPLSEQDGNAEAFEVDEKENRRVLRKVDWHVMPLLCVVYGLQYVSHQRRTCCYWHLTKINEPITDIKYSLIKRL